MANYNLDSHVSELVGKTLVSVQHHTEDDDRIEFVTQSGETFVMHHSQDCCETVFVEDICGNLEDLVGSPIIQAEESSSEETPEGVEEPSYRTDDSLMWTFYRLATAKGLVVIRWRGESNGYYSVGVDFEWRG
jgi:hypothetical protein